MSRKNLAQTSLSDALVKHHEALGELGGIHQLIEWKPIEKQMAGIHAKKQGEQAWPPLLMFKASLPQSRYGLGKQLARDLMFRRFISLGSAGRVIPSNGRKTAGKSQAFMKNSGLNAYFSRALPIKAKAYSKKSAFNPSAVVSAVRAKVSLKYLN